MRSDPRGCKGNSQEVTRFVSSLYKANGRCGLGIEGIRWDLRSTKQGWGQGWKRGSGDI